MHGRLSLHRSAGEFLQNLVSYHHNNHAYSDDGGDGNGDDSDDGNFDGDDGDDGVGGNSDGNDGDNDDGDGDDGEINITILPLAKPLLCASTRQSTLGRSSPTLISFPLPYETGTRNLLVLQVRNRSPRKPCRCHRNGSVRHRWDPTTSANTLMLTVLSCSKKCRLATCRLEEEIINNNSYCFLNSSLSPAELSFKYSFSFNAHKALRDKYLILKLLLHDYRLQENVSKP